MKCQIRSHMGLYKMPPTQVFELLDGQLVVFLRSWGSQDYNQKFIDEIGHFLSTAQADIEVTSPFEFLESQTALANKVRISILLAHDYFIKSENKNSFSVGFEVAILMRHKKEIAWGAVGRFDIQKCSDKGSVTLSAVGTERDEVILLPIELVGVEKSIEIRLGSIHLSNEFLVVGSAFNGKLNFKLGSTANNLEFAEPVKEESSYWFSSIKLD
ncbi:MAG: hypothetical protein WA160_01240 [Pseudobdellovibrio sp.]